MDLKPKALEKLLAGLMSAERTDSFEWTWVILVKTRGGVFVKCTHFGRLR